MYRSIQDSINKLLAHLGKREHFGIGQTSTVVSPFPINLIGKYYYDHTLCTAVDINCFLTFFENTSAEIKFYCIDMPGIYRIRTDRIYTDKRDKIMRFATGGAAIFNKQHGLNIGFTGAISLPFLNFKNLNELQIKLCVYLALLSINSDCDHFPADKPESNKAHELNDTVELMTAVRNHRNSILYFTFGDKGLEYRVAGNSTKNLCMLILLAGHPSGHRNNLLNHANYSKVLSLLSVMSGAKQLDSLSSIPDEQFRTFVPRLPSDLRQVAIHYYQDVHMVREATEHWNNEDMESFGAVLSRSSLSECMTNGNEKLGTIIRKIDSLEGVYGTAIQTDRGYNELYILTRSEHKNSLVKDIEREILSRFQPGAEIRAAYISDGARIV